MRVIPAFAIEEAVAELCADAVCDLPEDVLQSLQEASLREIGPAQTVLKQILENAALARASRRPCCQDTGLAVVFLDIGMDAHIDGDAYAAVHAGVARAYTGAYLRKSSLSALGRENTGDNTPAIIHIRLIPGEDVHITVAPKGFGSENMSRLYMLKPSDGEEGICNSIVETAKLGAPNACPPIILGVGIGGTMESAALLAKRQLLRSIGTPAQSEHIRWLEALALEKINALNIGPMGLGGRTTALAVHIDEMPTHLAGLPVAINVQCHCARHKDIYI